MYSGKENNKSSCTDLEVTFPVLRLVSKPEFVNLRIIVKKEGSDSTDNHNGNFIFTNWTLNKELGW